jgi:hypothetical protein
MKSFLMVFFKKALRKKSSFSLHFEHFLGKSQFFLINTYIPILELDQIWSYALLLSINCDVIQSTHHVVVVATGGLKRVI